MNLPENYVSNMRKLLNEEADDYFRSFEEKRYYGLRVNTLKISVEDFLKISPFKLEPIPWTVDGFYYSEEERPSKHPYYYAGLYYLQEPSAMLPAEVLPVEKGDIILDACGAPGGKATKLSSKLNDTGILVANDISASRAKSLLKNIELSGTKNAYVISEDVSRIKGFDNAFDKILIDAPCSGEGMFRKENELIKSWMKNDSTYYVPIQRSIVEACIKMLKPGGMMVYSTCTFDIREDEEIVEYALSLDPSLKVMDINKYEGFKDGLTENTKGCVRLYPHKIKGEGHFVALIKKDKETAEKETVSDSVKCNEPFFDNCSMPFADGNFSIINNHLYFEKKHSFNLKGIRILRSGLLLGEYKNKRFEPSAALALALKKHEYPSVIDFEEDDIRVIKYLKCETLDISDFDVKGYVLVCVNGYPLGFGKADSETLKNRYPQAFRFQ